VGNIVSAVKTGLQIICLAALAVFIVMAIVYLPGRMTVDRGQLPVETLSTVDFVTIVLAAIGVILTALAIILAVAGVVGYAQIKTGASRSAERIASAFATKRVDEIVPRLVMEAVEQIGNKDMGGSKAIAESQSDVDL
jgi:hypothetical protein